MAGDAGGGRVDEAGDYQFVVHIEVGEWVFGPGLQHGWKLNAICFKEKGGAPLIAIDGILIFTNQAGADLDEMMGEGTFGNVVESSDGGFRGFLAADDSNVAEVKREAVFTTVWRGGPAGAYNLHFISRMDDRQSAGVGVKLPTDAGPKPGVFQANAHSVITVAQADDLFSCGTGDDSPYADAFGGGDFLGCNLLHGGEWKVEGILFAW